MARDEVGAGAKDWENKDPNCMYQLGSFYRKECKEQITEFEKMYPNNRGTESSMGSSNDKKGQRNMQEGP